MPFELTINGTTYDVTEFADRHPGGRLVLEPFRGADATHAFAAFHSKAAYNLLSTLPGRPCPRPATASCDSFDSDMHALRNQLVAEGLFRASPWYYARKVAEVNALYALAAALLWWGHAVAGGAVLGLGFQQAGWLAHDFLHQAVFRSYAANYAVGNWYLGLLLQGFSAVWWNAKHFRHHALPNGYYDAGDGMVSYDEDINSAPFLLWASHLRDTVPAWCQRWLLPRQHVYMLGILSLAKVMWNRRSACVCVAGRRWAHVAATVAHYAAFAAAAWRLSGRVWWAACTWYLTGLLVGGFLLAFVFVQSHNGMESNEGLTGLGFYTSQLLATRNNTGDAATTWFTGGLNFQIEHHLFPRMPRHNLRAVQRRVQQVCARWGVAYQELGLVASTKVLLRHLKSLGTRHARAD